MSVSNANFKVLFPEFENESDARLNLVKGFAENGINRSVFDTKADQATYLLMGHYLTLFNRRGAAGSVTQEKVGDLSVSYGKVDSKTQSELAQTSYGALLIQLMNTLTITPRVIGCE